MLKEKVDMEIVICTFLFDTKMVDGGAGINFGDAINTSASEGGAYVLPDGKYSSLTDM